MFSYISIEDFCNLKNLEIDFDYNDTPDKNININILVGRNGSGKSCLLDALFEIGANNLKNKVGDSDSCSFKYQIMVGENVLCEKPIKNTPIQDFNKKDFLWDKVIRLYTGSTERQNKDFDSNIFDIKEDEAKWALLALFISGYWEYINKKENVELLDLLNKILNLTLGYNIEDNNKKNKKKIDPKIIWIEQELEFNELNEIEQSKKELEDNISEYLKIEKPDYSIIYKTNKVRYFWKLDSLTKNRSQISSLNNNDKIRPLELFSLILNKVQPNRHRQYFTLNERYTNTGFLFSKTSEDNDDDILFPDQSLSDGELGLLRRLMLLLILRLENLEAKEKEKYLILLDEPETHFNEYWKSYFLYLVEEILEDTGKQHDVFIATHSAMLVTDAKHHELHRLEAKLKGVKKINTSNTYGTNVVDIGQSLFKMEADIGKRSRDEITKALTEGNKETLNKLLKQVGPGEWRWRIRAKLNELEKKQSCKNYVPRDGKA